MGKASRRAARVLGSGLALALLASAVGAGVQALGETPAKRIALAMTPSFPASEPLVTGDALRLDVTAGADFAAYSSGTVIYYDSRYFAPCDAAGSLFTATARGEGIGGYLDLNPANPLCMAGEAFGDVNADNLADYPAAWKDGTTGALLPAYQNYAAVALKIPYDLEQTPETGVPGLEMPWFTFYLAVIAPTGPGETAAVFMSPDALRGEDSRSAPMYYGAAPGGAGWLGVEVTLPARLDYAAEARAANPVRVNFEVPQGARGSLTGGITYVRNIEWGTTIAEQSARRWPGTAADTGYYLAGWTYPGDHEQGPLPGGTVLGAIGGEYVREITLVPVFLPRRVQVQLYLTDLSRPAGAQEAGLGEPLDLRVGFPFGEDVAALRPALESYPVDASSGWFLEIFDKPYIVPEIDDEMLRVEIARVHRGTWFIDYAPGGGDVENLPPRTEKPMGVAVQVSAQRPTRRGYAFSHWQDGAGSRYDPGQGWAENRDLDLTAMWGRNPDPYVEGGGPRALQYRSSMTLHLVTSAPGGATWSSSNPGVAWVNPDTGEVRGAGRGTATITGRDGDGFEAGVSVTVNYAWWQWLIVVLLFGWIWY